MKRRLAVLAVSAAALFGGVVTAPSTHSALSPETAARHCSSRDVNAYLSWGHKCLQRGQYCKLSGEREYHRYGFHCHRSSRDRNGDHHLT